MVGAQCDPDLADSTVNLRPGATSGGSDLGALASRAALPFSPEFDVREPPPPPANDTCATPTVVSAPNPTSWYTTEGSGAACDTSDIYPLYNPPYDLGLRVQVVVTRMAQLEAIAFTSTVTLEGTSVAWSETTP